MDKEYYLTVFCHFGKAVDNSNLKLLTTYISFQAKYDKLAMEAFEGMVEVSMPLKLLAATEPGEVVCDSQGKQIPMGQGILYGPSLG